MRRNEMFKTLVKVKGLEHVELKMQYRFDEFNVNKGRKIEQGYHVRIFTIELTEISRTIDSKNGVDISLLKTKYRSVKLYCEAMENAKKNIPSLMKGIWDKKQYPEHELNRVIDYIRDELTKEIEHFKKVKK